MDFGRLDLQSRVHGHLAALVSLWRDLGELLPDHLAVLRAVIEAAPEDAVEAIEVVFDPDEPSRSAAERAVLAALEHLHGRPATADARLAAMRQEAKTCRAEAGSLLGHVQRDLLSEQAARHTRDDSLRVFGVRDAAMEADVAAGMVQSWLASDAVRDELSDLRIALDVQRQFTVLASLNAVGLERSHVVDASEDLAQRIGQLLPPAAKTPAGDRVHRFFEQTFDLVPDIHAHVKASERALTRAAGGLADTLSCVEMRPLRLRVLGTAGCGKSTVANRFFAASGEAGKRPLLVCFNRPLAERLKATTGKHGMVETWYGLLDRFLKSRGHTLDYEAMKTDPNFWNDVQEKVIAEPVPDDWRFDTLIVDEGQDFEPDWYDILRMFITDDADVLWLEDPDQAILTDVDPDDRNLDHARRLIFSGATRATVRLEMLVRGDNPAVQRFLQ